MYYSSIQTPPTQAQPDALLHCPLLVNEEQLTVGITLGMLLGLRLGLLLGLRLGLLLGRKLGLLLGRRLGLLLGTDDVSVGNGSSA